jgi:hypothetical protein
MVRLSGHFVTTSVVFNSGSWNGEQCKTLCPHKKGSCNRSDEEQQKSKMRGKLLALIVNALLDGRRNGKSNVKDQKPK